MYTIYIRASCGVKNGLGHIMRCINLSLELVEYNLKVIFLIDHNPVAISLLESKGILYNILYNIDLDSKFSCDSSNNLHEELTQIQNIIKDKDTSIVLTDSYCMSNNYLLSLKNCCKYLISIDDLNLYDYPSDIIINSNIFAYDLNYSYKNNTLYLLGTKYLILKADFRDCPRFIVNNIARNVLITMGGADVNNFTPTLIDYLKDIDDIVLNVVIGPGFQNIEYLYENYSTISNINLIYNPSSMKDLIYKNDIAISSASTTAYELASTGIPSILVIQADNQVRLANKMNTLCAMLNVGWYFDLNEDFKHTVVSFINNCDLRISMSKVCKNIISEYGQINIINELIKLLN